jgi:CHAT domain-containing protein
MATHGFFAEGCAPSAARSPLLLSGLALAGANRRGELKPEDEEEDGILTAEEITSLDLSKADWVVLSACETGLGKLEAGEGVLGLRRAFQVAGVGTVIMSLWPVEDVSTRAWMKHLYEERLAGASTSEAVRGASLKVIAERRKAGKSVHPSTWGAFVAAGDWR